MCIGMSMRGMRAKRWKKYGETMEEKWSKRLDEGKVKQLLCVPGVHLELR